MLCEKCKNHQATVFYQENINGHKRSYSLCASCAADQENESLSSSPTSAYEVFGNQLFGGLFGHVAPQRSKECPSCGATFNDFRRNGKMGCPDCYGAFHDELQSTVRSIHGNVKHVGRSPVRFRKDREKQDRLADLRGQMKTAIEAENFELAAKLRDEIRTLEDAQ